MNMSKVKYKLISLLIVSLVFQSNSAENITTSFSTITTASLIFKSDSTENITNSVSTTQPPSPARPDWWDDLPQGVDVFYWLHNNTLHYTHPNWTYLDCSFKFYETYDYYLYEFAFSFDYLQCYCYGDRGVCDNMEINEEIKRFIEHIDGSILDNSEHRNQIAAEEFNKYLVFNVIMCISYCIVFLWGIIGNGLVIITVLGFLNRRNVTNIFIVNMSISDFLVVLLALPMQAVDRIRGYWFLGQWLCRCAVSLYNTSLFVSSFTMTAMAMERYLVICYPMKAQYVSTAKRARIIIGIIWVAAVALSIPQAWFTMTGTRCRLHYSLMYPFNGEHSELVDPTAFLIKLFIAVVGFTLPLIIMTFAYTRTGVALYRSVKEAGAMMGSGSTGSGDSEKVKKDAQKKMEDLKARIEVIKMLVAVLIIFVVAWLPNILFELYFFTGHWYSFDRTGASEEESAKYNTLVWDRQFLYSRLIAATSLLTFINSCINPVIYAFLSKSFMKGFVRCFGWCPCCKSLAIKYKTEATTVVSSGFTRSTAGVSTISRDIPPGGGTTISQDTAASNKKGGSSTALTAAVGAGVGVDSGKTKNLLVSSTGV